MMCLSNPSKTRELGSEADLDHCTLNKNILGHLGGAAIDSWPCVSNWHLVMKSSGETGENDPNLVTHWKSPRSWPHVQVRGSQQLTSHRCTVHLLVLRWSCVVPQDIVAAWGIVEGLASEVARLVSAMVSARNATDSVGCVKWRANYKQLQPGVSYDMFKKYYIIIYYISYYIILLQEKRTEAPSPRVKTTPGIRGHWMPAAGGSAWLKCA